MKTQENCNHIFKKPLEFFIPSIDLYGSENIDWILYTVADKQETVFIDSPDFTGPRQKVGTGGIVLRNLKLLFKKHFLNDPKIFSVIKNEVSDDKLSKEVLKILSYIEELLRSRSSGNPLIEFDYSKPLYPTLKLEDSPFMQFIDISGTIKFAEILKNIVIHGQYDAKNRI
jgi:hypothetical protein